MMPEQKKLARKEFNWLEQVVKTALACDVFLNCGYTGNQLEMERQEERNREMQNPVQRLWSRMDKSMETEVYRQFLFDDKPLLQQCEEPCTSHQRDYQIESKGTYNENDPGGCQVRSKGSYQEDNSHCLNQKRNLAGLD